MWKERWDQHNARLQKRLFSKDETIFLVRSPKDKYDVDSVDMGLCLGGQVQHAQAGTGPRCAAWTQIWIWANSVAGSGLDIWFLTWAQSEQFNCAAKHQASCKEEVYSFPCFCCFLSTGRMLSLLVVSPTWCWDHPRDHHPLLTPLVMIICCLSNLVVPLGPLLPSLCYVYPRPASAYPAPTGTATSDPEMFSQVRSVWPDSAWR